MFCSLNQLERWTQHSEAVRMTEENKLMALKRCFAGRTSRYVQCGKSVGQLPTVRHALKGSPHGPVVDFVTVKAPKIHKDQQESRNPRYVIQSKSLNFARFQQISINDLTCFGSRRLCPRPSSPATGGMTVSRVWVVTNGIAKRDGNRADAHKVSPVARC